MAPDTAKERVEAVGRQLARQPMPAVKKMAGPATGARLDGKVVAITGANSALGIGRASALLFAESGARAIYVCDVDDTDLAAHRAEIAARFPAVEVHARRFDAADAGAVRGLVDDALARYGRLDVFFANAGVTGPHAHFRDIEPDEFMDVMRTNVASVFVAAGQAVEAMSKTSASKAAPSGSFIATASVAGLRSNAGSTAYSASKAAVISLVQTCAYQAAGTGVRFNAVCPGLIETGMTAPTFEMARARGTDGKIGQLNPLRRAGVADEVARVALFLASDEASYVNGQAWAVDGGLSAGLPFVPGRLA